MNAKNIKSKLTRAASIASVVVVGALFAPSASAYEGDPWFHEWVMSTYVEFVDTVDNQFYNINMYMAEMNSYLNSGQGETGTGVIGTINKIWQEARPYQQAISDSNSAWGRTNMKDGVILQGIANRIPDPRNCAELPMLTGARSAGGGGGGGRRAKGTTEAKIAQQQGGTKPSDTAYANDAYAAHKSGGYCAAEDSKFTDGTDRNANGCTDADIHKMPDADSRVQSIFRPAHDYADRSGRAVKNYGTSLTYNLGKNTPLDIGDQSKAADDAIATMVARFSPPALPKDVEQTPGGKVLNTKIKVFNSRISPAVDFLTTAKGRLDASQVELPQSIIDTLLTDFKSFYARVFPDSPIPDKASEAEIMRYEVLRRYADPEGDWTQTLTASGDAAKVGQIQAQNQAVELYLLYNMHERQLETNALLSAILAQSVNPITRAEIESAAIKLSK